jgi:hypothetical protein
MTKSLTQKQEKPKAKKKPVERKVAPKEPAKRSVGRPSAYKAEYVDQSYRLCLLGATDKEMAEFFQVSEVTFNAWKHEHPEFLKSMQDGKVFADSNVAHSLYKRATGYTAKKVVTANVQGMITDVKEINDYVGPDTAAASLWLRNRQPTKWRDKIDHEIAGKDGGPIEHSLKVEFTKPE